MGIPPKEQWRDFTLSSMLLVLPGEMCQAAFLQQKHSKSRPFEHKIKNKSVRQDVCQIKAYGYGCSDKSLSFFSVGPYCTDTTIHLKPGTKYKQDDYPGQSKSQLFTDVKNCWVELEVDRPTCKKRIGPLDPLIFELYALYI